MIDDIDTDRVTNGCVSAYSGYVAAGFAAYAEMMTLGFDFWQSALTGLAGEAPAGPRRDGTSTFGVPVRAEPAFGLARDDWNGLPWLDPARMDQFAKLAFSSDPFDVFSCMTAFSPLRGNAAAWPMAKQMIDAGVPRSIAWPAAEANAAALDATVAASAPMRKVYATAHSTSGYAMPAGFQAMDGITHLAAAALPAMLFVMWAMPALMANRTQFT